jgi:hypothetical protein
MILWKLFPVAGESDCDPHHSRGRSGGKIRIQHAWWFNQRTPSANVNPAGVADYHSLSQ